MNIHFLGQGFESESENSVGNHLIDLLSQESFHTFTGISAFASDAGITGLKENIENAKDKFEALRLIVGVDQDGTSKEALLAIKDLMIDSYIFYQKEAPIFHPKIYLFEGQKKTVLIIGSSNMTTRGLFSNIEGSISIEFSNTDTEGQKLLGEMKEYYKGLFELSDPNLFKITDEVINGFIEKGIVPPETVRYNRYAKQTNGKKTTVSESLVIPPRGTVKLPQAFRGSGKPKQGIEKVVKELEIPSFSRLIPNSIIWQKKNIPSSDAQHVSVGTSITGVIRLSDAKFKLAGNKIDRNSYFRNDLFGELQWELKKRVHNSPLQIAYGKFEIVVNGNNLGIKSLKISHDPDRISNQNNVPTTIHWGQDMVLYLRNHNVTGKTLTLFAPVPDTDVFRIEIR